MSGIIDRALDIINDHLKDQTSFDTPALTPTMGRPMARGGRLLEDDFPTHYMPKVGRQVMAAGGEPEGPISNALNVARSISKAPSLQSQEPKIIPAISSEESIRPALPESQPAPMGHNMPPEPMQTVGASMPMEGLHPQLISQRLPTAKKAGEDPNAQALLVGLYAAKMHPKSFEHNVELAKTYDHLRPEEMQGSHDEVAENFINHLKDNYLFLHDSMPEHLRARAKEWYVGANKFSNRLAEEHGSDPAASAAAIAAMSPQKDWFQNASLAERLFDIHHNHGDENYSHDMEMTANRIFGKEKFDSLLNEVRGKRYNDIDDPRLKAIWARLYDETYHDPSHRLMIPEGVIGDWVTNQDGSRSRVSWGSTAEILKGIQALDQGADRQKISDLMGERHKIRNFYNNILDPHSPTQDVTVDTHAVAGGLLEPLGANATQVSHNFKNNVQDKSPASKGSAETGVQGTYPFYAEALRRAAAERGIEPREMQSITWEGLKGLFPDTFKTEKNIAAVRGIWKNYAAGNIDIDDARKQIVSLAGGMNEPAWSGSAPISDEGAPHSTYERKLSDPRLHGKSAAVEPGVGGADTSAVSGLEEPQLRSFQRNRELTRASRKAFGQEALPQSFSRRTGRVGKNNVTTDFDAPIRAVYDATPEAQEVFSAAGISAPSMVELASGAKGANAFHNAITKSKETNPLAASVHAYDPKEYAGMRLFMTPNGKAGFALKGDDIVSVFNSKDSGHAHVSNAMLQLALAQGGRRLDAFDTALPHIYSRNKFRVSSRMPWNEEYKPEGWNHGDFSAYNNGRPDVVFMHYDPTYDQLYDGAQGVTTDDYDNAVKLQSAGVKKAEGNIAKMMKPAKAAKAYGGSITGPKLTEENVDEFARRLILWSYAAAPLMGRAEGGAVNYPVEMPTEIKEDLKSGKAKLRDLSPQEFLNEADPLHIGKGDRRIIDSFEHHIERGHAMGPLKLYEGGHQDGRHRANAAKKLGVKKVPVIDYRKADGGSVDAIQDAVDTARNLTPMGFYSAASEAASKIPQRAPIDQILNKLKGSPNVKAEELDWSGVRDAFSGQKSVDPQDVATHLQANLPQIKETVYGYDPKTKMKTALKPRYQDYTTPGGQNYREVLLHLSSAKPKDVEDAAQKKFGKSYSELGPLDQLELHDEQMDRSDDYRSPHWGTTSRNEAVPNILAHLRMTDRGIKGFGDPEALHIEEVQSDWGQAGRDNGFRKAGEKGGLSRDEEAEYLRLHSMAGSDRTEEQQDRLDELLNRWNKSDGQVPYGPHITSTEGWTDLALKRALLEAAKGKYKKLTWTPGEEQTARYPGLDKSFSQIHYSPDTNHLFAKGHDGVEDINMKVNEDALPSFIGKELADKLLARPAIDNTQPSVKGNTIKSLIGGQLVVPQKGQRDFYDRIIPSRLQKLVSKLDPDAKVQLYGHKIFVPGENFPKDEYDQHEGADEDDYEFKKVHSLEITPKLRAAILKGLPAYDRGGAIIDRAFEVLSKLPQ